MLNKDYSTMKEGEMLTQNFACSDPGSMGRQS